MQAKPQESSIAILNDSDIDKYVYCIHLQCHIFFHLPVKTTPRLMLTKTLMQTQGYSNIMHFKCDIVL